MSKDEIKKKNLKKSKLTRVNLQNSDLGYETEIIL
jgi:uncharacterized protein YjbI with pentapeptide repeats